MLELIFAHPIITILLIIVTSNAVCEIMNAYRGDC